MSTTGGTSNKDTKEHCQKIRVAICGGGIGGLALAVFLSRASRLPSHTDTEIEIDIYESASRFAEIGAGIGMWPRTWRIMQATGLADDLAKIAVVPDMDKMHTAFIFRKGDERPEGYSFERLETQGGLISYHRPDLQAVLLRHLAINTEGGTGGRCRTHTAKRLVSYERVSVGSSRSGLETPVGSTAGMDTDTELRLHFADGTHAACDLLVGADGVKSVVRAGVLSGRAAWVKRRARERMRGVQHLAQDASARTGDAKRAAEDPDAIEEAAEEAAQKLLRCVPPQWSGLLSYRTTVRSEVLRERWPGHRVLECGHLYVGKDSQLTVYPIGHDGALISISAFVVRAPAGAPLPPPGLWVAPADKEELVRAFGAWEEEVRVMLDCVEKTSRWAVPTCAELPTFVAEEGDVVLLGDAAHAMLPFQGSGAGQAIEDAYILAALLTHPRTTSTGTRPALARVAAVYDAVRRPFAQRVARWSGEAGTLYTLRFPGLEVGSSEDADGEGAGEGRGHGHGYGEDKPPPDPVREAARTREQQERRTRDREVLGRIYERVRDNWRWAWETTVEGDRERAVAMLEGRVPLCVADVGESEAKL